MRKPSVRFLLLCALVPWILPAQDGFKAVQNQVVEHTLKNGLKFLILPRHDAPVVSFHTYMNVGSVDDPGGQTGLAHMFEHMAFKGTETIGTRDWPSEKKASRGVVAVQLGLPRPALRKSEGLPAAVSLAAVMRKSFNSNGLSFASVRICARVMWVVLGLDIFLLHLLH